LEAIVVPSKLGNFCGDDVVANFEVKEDDTCIADNIIMPPPSSHGHCSQEQVEAIKELQ
jgi:hypothetical protein